MDILKKIKLKPIFQKGLSLLISAAIIFSVVAVGIVAAAEQTTNWDGSKDSALEGAGTEADPKLIKTAAQLAYVVSTDLTDGWYFKLANDIVINDTSVAGWKDTALNWVWGDIRFTGTFDGDGHTIEGLYYSGSQQRMGLFSYVGAKNGVPCTIKNFGLKGAYINHTGTVEGASFVAGQTSGTATFENIYIDENSVLNAPNVTGVGGISGRGNTNGNKAGAVINNCAVLGSITGKSAVGAFTGTYWAADAYVNINGSFTTANYPLSGNKVLTDSAKNYGPISYEAGTAVITAEQIKGEAAKTNMPLLDFENVWQTVENGFPVLKSQASGLPVWAGKPANLSAVAYAGGTGTAEDPYLIENGDQLYKMVAENSASTTTVAPTTQLYFKLIADIDLGGKQWYTHSKWSDNITAANYGTGFNGVINGDGHKIYGLTVAGTSSYSSAGLIPIAAQGAEIYNLHLVNGNLSQTAWNGRAVAAFIGIAVGSDNSKPVVIENCSVKGFNIASENGSAAFVAYGYTQSIKIKNCFVTDTTISQTGTDASSHSAAFIAVLRGGTKGNTISIENSYYCGNIAPKFIELEGDFSSVTTFTSVYTNNDSYDGSVTGVTKLTDEQMTGENAKTNMTGFNFDTVWNTVENGFPVIEVREPAVVPAWDGSKDSNLEGSGTEAAPYLIKTAAQLAYVVSTNLTDGLYFKLANDIKINDTSLADWKASAKNWVWGDIRFTGTFDGDGHTIDGLYFSGSQKRIGLFSYVGANAEGTIPCTIKNFTLTNAYINNTSSEEGSGLVCGQTSASATFENIYVDDTCTLVATNSKGVAAIAPRGNTVDETINITNCVVLASITGKSHVGAFVGTYWRSGDTVNITNSFTASTVAVVGGVSGVKNITNVYGTVADTYGTVVLTADQMKGADAKTNMPMLDFDTVFETVDGDYPVINVREAVIVPEVLWDGTKDSNLEGSGTEAAPYLIKTPAQLAYVVSTDLTDGLYFKLANDIKIHDTSVANWKDYAKKWVWGNIRFTGTFDGDGHTIDGLYFSASQSRIGLFSYVGANSAGTIPCTIKNFTLTNAYINNTSSDEGSGLVCGQTSASTTFENIYIDDTCTLNAPNSKGVAAIAPRGYSVDETINITNCVVLASITGKSHVGAFVGTYWRSGDTVNITNSFTASTVAVVGGVSGVKNITNVYGTVADTYGTVVLTADQMKGADAKTNMPMLDFDTVFETVDGDFPIINIREFTPPPPAEPLPDYVWDGTAANSFAGGTGTEEDPFLIETPEQLYKMVKEYSTRLASLGVYFKLNADIYLNDTQDGTFVKDRTNKQNWLAEYGTGIPKASKDNSFAGTFDGNNHTVYGLYINGAGSAGLFPALSSGVTIKNLAVKNAYITGGSGYAGGIAGQLIYVDWHLSNKIANCSVTNAIIGENGNVTAVGGLVGNTESSSVTFQNCYTYDLTLSDQAVAGGITGNAWSNGANITLDGCYTVGNFPVRSSTNSVKCVNVYTDTAAPTGNTTSGVTILSNEQMKGENAKTNMSALDFVRTFKTVENGYPVHFVYVRPDNVWDGKIAESFAGGKGTAEDPYLIENGGQLYKMVAEFSNQTVTEKATATNRPYFRITKDIDLGYNQWYTIGVTSWIDNAAYTTIGFRGVIYGDGHVIKGLYNEVAAGAVGLIPVAAQGAEIYDLHLDGGKLPRVNYQTYAVGALIGFSRGASNATPIVIKGCSVKNFEIGAVNAAAGMLGYAYSSSVGIYNSYVSGSTVKVTADTSANAAAFVGYTGGNDWLNTIKIANSYAADVNPIPFLNEKFAKITTFTNVYTNYAGYSGSTEGVTLLTTEQMKGENAKTYMKGFEFGFNWQTVENDFPIHILYVKPSYVWDGGTASSFAGGDGSSGNPFLISNGAQLYKMVSEYSNASGASGTINKQYYFKLTNDIYLNDVKAADLANTTEAHWTSKFNAWYSTTSYSKGFCGDLDGAGFTVYGLYTNKGYAGLIPVLMDGGNIHNLNLKNSYVLGTEAAGGLVGFVKAHWKMSPVTISYCTVDNIVVETPKVYAGGLVGGCADIKTSVTDCSVTRAKVISTNENPNYATAFIGFGWGSIVNSIENCFTDSTVHPVSATTNKEAFGTLAARYSFTNVYTSFAKNFAVEGVTYLDSDAKLQGENVSSVLKGFDFKADWLATESFPVIRQGAGAWRFDTTKPGEVWSGKLAAAYASGDGTKEHPYIIETGGQLALLANDALNGKTVGRYYKITADIILNKTSSAGWEAKANEWFTGSWAKAFRGYLDGGYHTISGLYLNKTKETYKGTDYYGGLFAAIGQGAVIEKLGIVNSSLTFTHDVSTKYLGVFAGFIDQYDAAKAGYNEYPIIRECFADTSVYLNGGSCGGMIGCTTRPIRIENSFFTGTVKDTGRGLFGYSKMNKDYEVVLVKNFYTAHSKFAVISNNSYDNMRYENTYSSSAQDKEGITRLFVDRMCGEAAKEYMTGFDFSRIWVIGEESHTPGLKGFKKDSYSNLMNPEDITVSFETGCDIEVKSMTGKAYSKLELPVIEREGYIFEGWYAYAELDTPYTFDYFPTFDVILHAKWTLDGFEQDFEQYENSVYDFHEGLDYYRPTSDGYNAKYVRSGGKGMHRLGEGSDYRDFLLFYHEELEVGKTYKMVFYTTTDAEKAETTLSLVHLNWPDVYSDNAGVEAMGTIEGLTDGKWIENTYVFTAKTKWLAIRTEGEGSIYFDDFILYNTSDDASGLVSGSIFGNTWVLVTIIGLAVLLLGAGAVVTVVVIKRKK